MSPRKTDPALLGQTMNLAGLVDYQTGAVVSRTVVDKQAGTATAFSFDDGQGLSEHIAPYDALVYVMDGAVEVTIDDQPHRVEQGEMIIMPAHLPHALRALTRFKMLLVMIRSEG